MGFWIADSFNIVRLASVGIVIEDLCVLEYLDDIVVYGCQWSLLVAVMALRLDWLFDLWYLYLYDWENWCYLSYSVPCR